MFDDDLIAYLWEVSVREPEAMARVRETTADRPDSGLQIGPEQGHFLAWLVRLTGARRCLEVGTYTGYSALAVALALPEDGTLDCCEIDPETAAIARANWDTAGVDGRIALHVGPEKKTLDGFLADGRAGTYDFAFIDADKAGYPEYVDLCARLVHSGGLLALDNMLWHGGVYPKPRDGDASAALIDGLNRTLPQDPRFDAFLLPLGDGILLLRVR